MSPQSLRAHVGETINVTCPARNSGPGTRKFVCKKPCGGNDVSIKSDQPSHGRYTVENSETGQFIVTISKLQKSDAGTYRCGVGGFMYHDVDVTVVGDDEITTSVLKTTTQPAVTDHTGERFVMSPQSLRAHVGETINVTCPARNSGPGTRKFVCKKPCGGNDVSIKSDQPSHGRYTVENSETGQFIVTISKLQKSDAGTYRCGVGGFMYHDVDVTVVGDDEITTSVLKTTTQPAVTDHTGERFVMSPQSLRAHVGETINVTCPARNSGPGTRKFVCKKPCGGNDVSIKSDQPSHGRYTVENSETGQFIVTISKLQKSDAGTYRCGVGGFMYHDVDVTVVGDDEITPSVLKTTTQPAVTDHRE
ncbi:polymeric immunoglobulin receptor-like [Chanos chanos]|uniref:polymeric immunoglobulin receptor-like n=3 Tax=Chanos chanos TaxID=29144 RepID=UPI0011F32E76|nr:polymeric immunoglobulin receptor-like [Chanos chanos]